MKNRIHKFLDWIVAQMIRRDIGTNCNAFKKGDLICYSWRAHVYLEGYIDKKDFTYIVHDHVDGTGGTGSNVRYHLPGSVELDESAAFWMRKVRWYERVKTKPAA